MSSAPTSSGPTSVRVATAQFFSGEDPSANLELCRSYLRAAAAQGVQLLVLPENSNRVRAYGSREECFEHSEDLDGPFVTGLRETCAELGLHLAVGVDLRMPEAPGVWIASVLIGPDGSILHVHHKHVLWDYEYTLFVPGDEPYRVIDTPLGRLGLQICADGIVPETPRALALLGAQILCNSLNSRGPDELRIHVPLRAMENRVWHVSSNTVGGPADQWPWMGGSQVVAPDGRVLAEASESDEEMVVADIDPGLADDKANEWAEDIFAWRRPDLYGDLVRPLGEVAAAGIYGPAPEGPARPVPVAMMQVSWFHTTEWTITRALGQIAYAGRRGARLGLLPELFCFRPGEVAADPAWAAATSAEVLALVQKAAADAGLWVGCHLVEEEDGRHHSTAYLVGQDGDVVGRYRKTHLSRSETEWATPGDDLPVWDTPVGRIGFMLGDEVWIPEVMRVLALRGAEVVLHPCSWDRTEAATVAATERTEENRVHLVSVARLDNPAGFGSQVLRADLFEAGQPIAVMRYPTGHWTRPGFEEQVVVTLDLREANSKMMGHHLDPLRTRAPQLYGVMSEPS
jgi:predicted amidohydrolase